MKTPSTQKGFTLIELLVVIAIIGTLSSVVIASVNSARNKANDTALKAQLKELKKAIDIVYMQDGKIYQPGDESKSGAYTCVFCGSDSAGFYNSNPEIAKAAEPLKTLTQRYTSSAGFIGNTRGVLLQLNISASPAGGMVGSYYSLFVVGKSGKGFCMNNRNDVIVEFADGLTMGTGGFPSC